MKRNAGVMEIDGRKRIGVIALTKHGAMVGRRILDSLGEEDAVLFLPGRARGPFNDPLLFSDLFSDFEIRLFEKGLHHLVAEVFGGTYRALIFVMAVGIVVRVIAPYIKDKRTDPAVIVVDEGGHFAISLLSGHLGGANDLAQKVARGIGAMPVITTATDVWGRPAVDVLAKKFAMGIEHFEDLKHINAAIVNDEGIQIIVDSGLELPPEWKGWDITRYANVKTFSNGAFDGPIYDGSIYEGSSVRALPRVIITNRVVTGLPQLPQNPYIILRPKNIIVGLGCRRGAKGEAIIDAVLRALDKTSRSAMSIKHLATIDIKKDEPGLKEAARHFDVPLRIVEKGRILECENDFATSKFVKERIGVGSVCEPAAVLSGRQAKLILPKTIMKGITVAVAEEGSLWWESGPETLPT
ncbi:MAG: cobalt-precorrin 5A hydrolase [Firmicutes bacterium]|nr:cobalt-precorrin 5A hydrolase [Bacillota bacterium]